jgi:RNA polymerase sigma-70 factor (ECF subfamily)
VTTPQGQASFADAVRSGNHQRAAEWLVLSFGSEVFGLCLAIVRHPTAAEDLSQEVFASAFAALDGYRGDASARTWVLKIARNRCIDYLRKQKRWSGYDDEGDPDELPEEVSLPNTILSRRSEVESALLQLDEVERALIILRFRHGLDYQELAAAFGLKTGTTRMRVSRALAKMRSLLSEDMPAPSQAAPMAPRSAPAPSAPPPAARRPPPARSRSVAQAPAGPPPAPQAPAPAPSMRGAAPPMGSAPGGGRKPHVLNFYFDAIEAPLPSDLQQRLASMAASLPGS